jgi:PDZ domain-containing secreted protein
MAIQTATGWLLDVSHDPNTGFINLLIKLQDDRVISFKQKLKEYTFYAQPKTTPDGEDLFQQLSRNDQIFKKIFWANKYVDLADRNKTRLIGIDVADIHSHDYQTFINKLAIDSRVSYLYDTELSAIQQFIYNRLKIAPTSKIRVEYEEERLLSILKLDDSQEIDPPPFKIMHIRIDDDGHNDDITFKVRFEKGASVLFFVSKKMSQTLLSFTKTVNMITTLSAQ